MMNNPYRARPGRPRVDHAAVSNYNVQNKNMWPQMSAPKPSEIPQNVPSNMYQNPQTAPLSVSQSKDSSDWSNESFDNGNDAWNWSIDQSQEPQIQGQNVPNYQNLGQTQNLVPNNYYNNANGNNKTIHPPQQLLPSSGGTISGAASRESTPHLPKYDTYSNYSNYSLQHQTPSISNSQPTSLTSSIPSGNSNAAQWGQMNQQLPERQNSQSYSLPPVPTNFDVKNQNLPYQQQVQQVQIGQHQQFEANKYNWDNSTEQSSKERWQNPVQPSNVYWQNYADEHDSVKSVNNQWGQLSQQSDHQQAVKDMDEPIIQPPQWNQHEENQQKSLESHAPLHNIPLNEVNSQPQPPHLNQGWSGLSNDMEKKLTDKVGHTGSKIVNPEWQHVEQPVRHFSPSQSPLSGPPGSSQVQNQTSAQLQSAPKSEKLGVAPFASSMLPAESPFAKNPSNENKGNSNSSSIADVSSSLHQMSLNEPSHQFMDKQLEPSSVPHSSSVQPHLFEDISGSTTTPHPDLQAAQVLQKQVLQSNSAQSGPGEMASTPYHQEQVPTFSELNYSAHPSHIRPMNSQEVTFPSIKPTSGVNSEGIHGHSLPVQQPHRDNSIVPPENVVQPTNYDQWYNQNVSQASQVPQTPQNNWYSNLDKPQGKLQPQWTPPPVSGIAESLIDNCESIQPPAEFISSEEIHEVLGSETRPFEPHMDSKSVVHPPTVPSHFQQHPVDQTLEQTPSENYEFASNDRNTFLETGELTDSHHDQESTAPSQDDDNDEVSGEIPFLREVPGQSSNPDLPRNIPTGQEQYVIPPGSERRDVPPGQERRDSGSLNRDASRIDPDSFERRNDPSGRERSLPPVQSRNDPSGEERVHPQISQITAAVDSNLGGIDSGARQIPGEVSPNESADRMTAMANKKADDRNDRVVTGSQECSLTSIPQVMNTMQETREEAVGASTRDKTLITPGSPKRRDSYEDGDDEESGNSRDESRDRQRRDPSPLPDNRRRYDRSYYDHERSREFDDDYYYDRRRGDYDRPYNSREDLEHRDASFRDGERRYRAEDLDDPAARRARLKNDEERDGKSGAKRDERRSGRDREDVRRQDRDGRDYAYPRTPRDLRGPRDYPDADRRRRRFEDYDRDRRDYYDDPYARGSRPSSRSSYNERERDYYMRSRDSYYGYNNGYSGYEYGPNYNANYYAYLENLRRTNPTAYMEWYNKYYGNQHLHQQQQQQQHQPNSIPRVSNYPEDRASVHSGQSSCDDRTPSGKNMMGDLSMMEDSKIMARMTPTKFSTSHVQGIFSIGSLIHVHASYPADGDRARIDIVGVDSLLLHDPIVRELRAYPGPLIKGVTHKKTIIEYCETKIKKATSSERPNDRASYVLLYQLMIMLIQQNGNVVGVDIAALLLRNKEAYPYEVHEAHETMKKQLLRRESSLSERSSAAGEDASADETTISPESQESGKKDQLRKTVEQITTEFRNTLLYGLVQEALEYAMTEGLWGHALFLASKLDKRTHASVMTRFANSLSVQDPLQTLYQLHSGRVPASVTCLSDSKWDDWRPHLAMIISNTSNNPEINRRSITIMGDTMAARGDIYAAHFCYILAEIDFGMYGKSGAKMVLIGSNHNKPYEEFVNLEAVMLTEIYEYARNLSEPDFMLAALQTFKFENAQKMIDYGLVEKALLYLEQISLNIVNSPSKFKESLISEVFKLSERIKFHDPVFKDSLEDEGSLIWLNNLAEIVGKYQTGEISQDIFQSREMLSEPQDMQQHQEQAGVQQQVQQTQWNSQFNPPEYSEGGVSMMEVPTADVTQEQWQPVSNQSSMQYVQGQDQNQYQVQSVANQQQQDYWGQPQSYTQQDYADWQHQPQSSQPQSYQQEQTDVDSTQQSNAWNYEPQPQISMGPASGKQYDPLEELDALEQPKNQSKSSDANKTAEKSGEKKASNTSGGSWFGGLFSKLAPKPKNQMILPDDNNPTIVWDPVGKKWMNKDEDSEGGSSSLAPPPKAANMGFKPAPVEPAMPTPQPQLNPPNPSITEEATTPNSSKIITGNNMFKLQKGRSMRANYIDVMNPNVAKGNSGNLPVPTPTSSPMAPMAASSPQLFIPAPVNDPNAPVNFLTPTPAIIPSNENASQGLSRWSSTSSLSREVQSYTMRDPRTHQRTKGSMGYNQREENKESLLRNAPRTRNQLR